MPDRPICKTLTCRLNRQKLGALIWRGGIQYDRKCPVCGAVYTGDVDPKRVTPAENQETIDRLFKTWRV